MYWRKWMYFVCWIVCCRNKLLGIEWWGMDFCQNHNIVYVDILDQSHYFWLVWRIDPCDSIPGSHVSCHCRQFGYTEKTLKTVVDGLVEQLAHPHPLVRHNSLLTLQKLGLKKTEIVSKIVPMLGSTNVSSLPLCLHSQVSPFHPSLSLLPHLFFVCLE